MKEMKLSEIAQTLGLTAELKQDAVVRTVLPLERASKDSISWVAAKGHTENAEKSKAAAVLVANDVELPECNVIRAENFAQSLRELLALFDPKQLDVPAGIHPSAVIDDSAKIASDASVGPFVAIQKGAVIESGAVLHAGVFIGAQSFIGENSVLWPYSVVYERCSVGRRCILHAHSCIGADGFGFDFEQGKFNRIPQIGTVVIEDDVEIGAQACVDRAKCGETRIKTGTKIDNLVQIAHNVQLGPHACIVAQAGIAGSAVVKDYVVLGGQSGIADNVTVEQGVQLAAQSGIARNASKKGQILYGAPAEERARYQKGHLALRRLPSALDKISELEQRIVELEKAKMEQK